MTNRTGQTWEEYGVIFVVVGPPVKTEVYDRHPVCILNSSEVARGEKFVDEGAIPWEDFPYMIRIG